MRLLVDRYTERLQADIARLTEERDAWHLLSQQYSAVIMDSVREHDVLTQEHARLKAENEQLSDYCTRNGL